jgi:HK97 family phage major capsid protein/HK97 family phage prohead protease
MDKAYSVLSVKAVSQSAGVVTVEGIASTPTPDRMGDIVEPLGAKFSLPMPLFMHHDSSLPVGRVVHARATKDGINFRAELPIINEPGTVKQRVDEAIHSLRHRLMGAVSIGFSGVKGAVERLKDGGLKFKEWDWLELSLVTIPANPDAVITGVKSIDDQLRAASGRERLGIDKPPGVPGSSQPPTGGFSFSRTSKGRTVKTLQELNDAREQKAARVAELSQMWEAEGRKANADEKAEATALHEDIEDLDGEILVAKAHALNASQAKPVNGDNAKSAAASRSRAPHITTKSNLPKGTIFTRYAVAMANGRGSVSDALEFAKRWERETPEVALLIKAAAGTADAGGTWGSQLVAEPMREFQELLMPETVIGKINGFKRVPFNTKIVEQTDGSTVAWVGENAVKPAGELDFDTFSLLINKVAGIVAFSDELARLSSPAAEAVVRNDMIKQIVKYLDVQFLDPNVTASNGIRPASVTNTASPTTATGTSADAFRADMRTMRAAMRAANISASGTALIMSGATADALADMMNALGQPEFPTISSAGGTYRGSQVIVSDSVPDTTNGSMIVLLKPSEILMADDGVTLIDVNRDGAVDLGAGLVSLWQRNLVAIRAERWITWLKARAAAVQYIEHANYEPDVVSA